MWPLRMSAPSSRCWKSTRRWVAIVRWPPKLTTWAKSFSIRNGLVPITGTATHPQFQHYELAFAYSPNPTGTWFPLQAPVNTQVVNEIIGRWDTTQISDGLYSLRLRVFYTNTAYLEAFVQNVRVQNATPTAEVSAAQT